MMMGTLTVKPICANLTIDKDWFSRMDPYVNVTIGNQKYKTRTANEAGKNPNWTDSFTYKITNETQLFFEIYDRDIGEDDFVGSGIVSLDAIYMKRNVQEWYEVYSHNLVKSTKKHNKPGNGKVVGKIMLIFEYIPQGYGMQGVIPNMGYNQMPNMQQQPPTMMMPNNMAQQPQFNQQQQIANKNSLPNDYTPSLDQKILPPQTQNMPRPPVNMAFGQNPNNRPNYNMPAPMPYGQYQNMNPPLMGYGPNPYPYPSMSQNPPMYPPNQQFPPQLNMNMQPYPNYGYGMNPYGQMPPYPNMRGPY